MGFKLNGMSFNKRVFLAVAIATSFVAIRIVQDNGFLNAGRAVVGRHRQLSVALEEGGCFVLPAQEVGPEVKPVFAGTHIRIYHVCLSPCDYCTHCTHSLKLKE